MNSEDEDETEVMEYNTGLAVGPDTATYSNEDPEPPLGNRFEDHNHYTEDELQDPYIKV